MELPAPQLRACAWGRGRVRCNLSEWQCLCGAQPSTARVGAASLYLLKIQATGVAVKVWVVLAWCHSCFWSWLHPYPLNTVLDIINHRYAISSLVAVACRMDSSKQMWVMVTDRNHLDNQHPTPAPSSGSQALCQFLFLKPILLRCFLYTRGHNFSSQEIP